MEGPTPVSALIHAATMVTAGVYLIVRTHSIFEAAPNVQHLSAIIGGVTIIVAGVIALVQWDIKRVIAYSTMSQIGYMFLAAGIGAYGYAMFHLMTHAFFKALLFLSAGVIIHHLGGEQDIRKMGGLRKVMPFTHAAFLVGALALAGHPAALGLLVEGRDHRVRPRRRWRARVHARRRSASLGALLTGAYTFRLYYLVFHGPPSDLVLAHSGGARARHGRRRRTDAHGHGEGPLSMLIPVGVLTVLAAIGGLRRDPRRLGAVPRLDRQRRRAARRSRPSRRSTRRAPSPSRSRPSASVVARRAFTGRPGARRRRPAAHRCSSTSSTSTSSTTRCSRGPPR